jgi:hypothetical protein
MSHYVNVKSVCGNATTSIDIYDLELNNEIVCCDNCKSILMCRKAWDYLYKESKWKHYKKS